MAAAPYTSKRARLGRVGRRAVPARARGARRSLCSGSAAVAMSPSLRVAGAGGGAIACSAITASRYRRLVGDLLGTLVLVIVDELADHRLIHVFHIEISAPRRQRDTMANTWVRSEKDFGWVGPDNRFQLAHH